MENTQDTGRARLAFFEFPAPAYVARWASFAERWTKHRLQDLQATIDLTARPWCAVDPGELAKLQRKWSSGIVDRCVLDMLSFAKNAFALPLDAGAAPAVAAKPAAGRTAVPRPRAKRRESEAK